MEKGLCFRNVIQHQADACVTLMWMVVSVIVVSRDTSAFLIVALVLATDMVHRRTHSMVIQNASQEKKR